MIRDGVMANAGMTGLGPSGRRASHELARWLDAHDAADEPGEWRCVIRLDDGTEVIGEDIAVGT